MMYNSLNPYSKILYDIFLDLKEWNTLASICHHLILPRMKWHSLIFILS